MPLKVTIDKLTDVDEPLRSLYAKGSDGRFTLALEGEPTGYVKASKLDEFRDNNRTLNSKVAELSAKLKSIEGIDDSAEFETLEAKLRAFDGIDPAEYQTLKSRVAEMETTLAAERAATAKAHFNNAVSVAFLKGLGRESAVDWVCHLAEKVFEFKDGKVTSSAFSTKNPGEPLSLDEWIVNQRQVIPYAFKESRGGGATPNPYGGVSSSVQAVMNKPTVISAHDPSEIGKNLDAIASGDVQVAGFGNSY
jgi:outer membrane murein-binding lipoprotein Lpp